MTTSNGGKAYGASGANNSAAFGQTANGNKYATANGNTYKNTGSGWKAQAQTPIRNTTRQVTRAPKRAVPVGGASRRKAADHRPGVAAVVVAGEAGKPALVVRLVWAVGAAGADERVGLSAVLVKSEIKV